MANFATFDRPAIASLASLTIAIFCTPTFHPFLKPLILSASPLSPTLAIAIPRDFTIMSASFDYIDKAASELYPLLNNEYTYTTELNGETVTFSQLDKWRNEEVPESLKERYHSNGLTWLDYDELVTLMDWKLQKGTYRPALPKMIRSNDAETVKKTTKEGFAIFLKHAEKYKKTSIWVSSEDDRKEYYATIRQTLKKLSELRAVGPATASLMLSLLYKITDSTPPYFSEESFEYFIVEPNGGNQKIKFTVKEFVEQLLPYYFDTLLPNTKLSPQTLEKGAWALRKYQKFRIDRFANVQPPFEIDEDHLKGFIDKNATSEESKVESLVNEVSNPRKRSTTAKKDSLNGKSKRSKT